MRRLRFMADNHPVQIVKVYYDPRRVAGSKLEQSVVIEDGVHAELRRLGGKVTRLVETSREPDSQLLMKSKPSSFQAGCQ
jgi:hypothetical protein